MQTVLFACVHNAGRSQMAAALFNQVADPARARAISAGTDPGPAVHSQVVEVMREVDIELSHATPTKLTPRVALQAAWLITMGCGDQCPVIAGASREDWPLEDPKGQPVDVVRMIRDEIHRRVRAFVRREGWSRNS